MDKIKRRLDRLTKDILSHKDMTDETGVLYEAEVNLLTELASVWKTFENLQIDIHDDIKERLDVTTNGILTLKHPNAIEIGSYVTELKTIKKLAVTWSAFSKVEIKFEGDETQEREERKSNKVWDKEDVEDSFTTEIELTPKQQEAMDYLDSKYFDMILLLGGSGSGKSFIEAYKIIRDALRYKAPCLVARDKMIDLTQGMIEQIVPTILQLIANANGQDDWKTWTIDGLKFAKWTDKRTRLEFATGGYVRFGGLSARDSSESGGDKILSPSWFHVMLEEISELEYAVVEKVLTRLRYNVDGVTNKLIMCENPPSVMHWSYRRFVEGKRTDGSLLPPDEKARHKWLLMNPQDNVQNLGENYIRTLAAFTGANRERFFLGSFQEYETGEIFEKMEWTDNLPLPSSYERIVLYVDPTPLTGDAHSEFADYKAMVLVGLHEGDTYVIDIRCIKGSTTSMLQGIKQLWDITPNTAITEIWMEKKQVPSDFIQVLTNFQNVTGWHVPIQMDKRIMGDKKTAIETFLQPLFVNGTIFFSQKFKEKERGKQAAFQILKFSRKKNKHIHDDIPDAIMRADTLLKGKKKRKRTERKRPIQFVKMGYVHRGG